MSLIVAAALGLSFGERTVFHNVHFQVAPGDRIGLIGPNGSGKTTLLRLIAGELHPQQGELRIRKGTRLGYLPQDPPPMADTSLLPFVLDSVPEKRDKERLLATLENRLNKTLDPGEVDRIAQQISLLHDEISYLDREYSRFEAERILSGLGFAQSEWERPLRVLSGGWHMRALLAAVLFRKPDVLLLDEPTNHLDLLSVRWLSSFLEEWKHALVLICHDREFLNRHTNRIFSIEPEGFRFFKGNYDAYLQSREQERVALENRARNMEKKVKEARKFIDRFRAKASKARQAQSKIKLLDKIELVKTHKVQKKLRFHFPPVARSGRVVLRVSNLSKRFGDRVLFENLNLDVLRGERIAVVGPNGCGKTTLLRILAGEAEPDGGSVALGHNVSVGYYAQEVVPTPTETRTILEEVQAVDPSLSPTFVRSVCGAFLFSDDEVFKRVGVLSGGERSRLALAKLLVKPANLMLMDEPTNHLDLFSSEALIQALEEYEGTLVFVSHNQSFINRLATKIWDAEGTRIEEYPGTLEDYFHHREQLRPSAPMESRPPERVLRRNDSKKDRRRRAALLRQERNRVLGPLRERVSELENEIHRLEHRQCEISELLATKEIIEDPGRSTPLMRESAEVGKRINELLEEWETRQEELEEAERRWAERSGEA